MNANQSTIHNHSAAPWIAIAVIALVLCGFDRAQGQWTSGSGSGITTTNDKVGVGTPSPGAPLTVVSNDAVTTPTTVIQNTHTNGFASIQIDRSSAYRFAATRYSTAGTDNWYVGTLYAGGSPNSVFSISPDYTLASSKFVLNSDGNVGIGTTSPQAKLSVITPNNSINQIEFGVTGQDRGALYKPDDTNGIYLYSAATAGANKPIHFFTGGTGTDERLTIAGSGNVGIGTTSPGYKLDVYGPSGNYPGRVASPDGYLVFGPANAGWSHFETDRPRFYFNKGVTVDTGNVSSYAQDLNLQTSGTTRLTINNSSGNVGLGTTNPIFKLDVYGPSGNYPGRVASPDGYLLFGPANAGWSHFETDRGRFYFNKGITVDSGNVGSYAQDLNLQTSGTTRLTINNSTGNVGLGTTTPSSLLHVLKSVSNASIVQVRNQNTTPGTSYGMFVAAGTNSTDYVLALRDAADNDLVRVLGNGYFGIGTPAPTQKLDVVGNINVSGAGAGNITLSGTINAKYQDVAEWVPSSEQLPAGTVVVLDSTKSNQVTSSSVSYDTRVAGVISEQPGIALGEKSEGKVLVATTGRVRVKVDATRGPINIGDLLVTSDVPGVAMKSEPVNLGGVQLHRPGTLIGKALEPLEKGKGEILVLLSLQ